MTFSGDGVTFGAYEPFATSRGWTLPGGDGRKTVYAHFKDAGGNVSTAAAATITLDGTPPTGTISVTLVTAANQPSGRDAEPTALLVSISASDPGNLSGVTGMRVRVARDFQQSPWEPYSTSKTLTGNDLGRTTEVYAQFRDGAGNVGAAVCARPDGVACLAVTYRVHAPVVLIN